MKKTLKVIISILSSLSMMLTMYIPISASSISIPLQLKATIEVHDSNHLAVETETKISTDIISLQKTNLFSSDGANKYIATVEAEISLLNGVVPYSQIGQTKGSGVVGRLNLEFYYSSSTEKIKVTRVFGGWTLENSSYEVYNRSVHAWTDTYDLKRYPNSNSFNYSTGWSYETFLPPSWISGAKANSTANFGVSGMIGGDSEVFIFLEITSGDL